MRRKHSLIFLLLAISIKISAQKITAKNAVFVEIGGKGVLYSLNYDRLFFQKNKIKLSARAGVGYVPENKVYSSALFVPLSLNAIYGRQNKSIELSVGQTFRFYPSYTLQGIYYPSYTESPITFIGLGYRLQKVDGGIFFTSTLLASFTPQNNTNSFSPWLGLGVGKSF